MMLNKIFGKRREKSLNSVDSQRGWRRIIHEPFAGAWQQNKEIAREDILCYPTLYACLSRIAQDIGKLPFTLKRKQTNGVWETVESAAYSPVLRRPNHYQTQQQFRESWMLSKLIQGNTYALKGRDNRGVVTHLYILDPFRVKPLVSTSGDVYYQLYTDDLNLVPGGENGQDLVVPARDIIHDRCVTLHHPLIGVPPVCAAYWPVVKNLRILRNAAEFFANGASPGGILIAPGPIDDDDAKELSDYWNTNFTGDKSGKIAVLGDGMKFEAMATKSVDSQMVEQLRHSDEQICQPFGIHPFKVGIGAIPAGMKIDDINQLYYSDALQAHIESMEALLDDGLAISSPMGVELDLEPLLRMDAEKRAEVETKLVSGKLKTPDEGRRSFNLAPTPGGDTLWGQHQDYPLGVLSQRNDVNPEPSPVPLPAPAVDETDKALALLWKRSPETLHHA
jgi:HK97 family phage portal protein